MFRGFTGCCIMWAGLVAGGVYGSITIILVSVGAGSCLAAASCWRAARKEQAAYKVPYPPYGY